MRGRQLSHKQRDQIIGAHLSGVKGAVIATQLNIASQTVYDTINCYKKTNNPHSKKCSGQLKTFTKHGEQLLQCNVLANYFAPLNIITNKLNTQLKTTFHVNIICKYIYKVGLNSHTT